MTSEKKIPKEHGKRKNKTKKTSTRKKNRKERDNTGNLTILSGGSNLSD